MADYLTVDDPIRGQKYVSLSYLCPESVLLRSKDVFFFSEFTKKFSESMHDLLENLQKMHPESAGLIDNIRSNHCDIFTNEQLQDRYKHFCETNTDWLDAKFHEDNEFRTTIRGIKIRGVYPTKKEADIHVQKIKSLDPHHNIWVGDLGAWLPFSDNPNSIDSQEYGNEQLNSLMKEYNKNRDQKNIEFADRKSTLIGNANLKNSSSDGAMSIMEESEDPWMASRAPVV